MRKESDCLKDPPNKNPIQLENKKSSPTTNRTHTKNPKKETPKGEGNSRPSAMSCGFRSLRLTLPENTSSGHPVRQARTQSFKFRPSAEEPECRIVSHASIVRVAIGVDCSNKFGDCIYVVIYFLRTSGERREGPLFHVIMTLLRSHCS